jgi:hypothetical protein
MKSELAEELIGKLMGWDRAVFAERVRRLEALATYKWDEYANFSPGMKFFESLATWLNQFSEPTDRASALAFVLERLLFISEAEMTHLIELVYPDHIEPVLRERVAQETDISPFRVAELVRHPAFAALRRRLLVLGASDGARLDRLRRSAPFLSHEQFLQSCEPPVDLVEPMRKKLIAALEKQGLEAPPTFAHVFLIDDFAGSGRTLLREENGTFEGKLCKLGLALARLREQELLAPEAEVTVVLYAASEQALEHLHSVIAASELPAWEVRVVQRLPGGVRVDESDPAFAALNERFYDQALSDEHKGEAPLGYARCALPLVLSHNTPNNSVSLLWGDTTAEPESLHRHALFPRYERHHRDRP